MHADVFVEAQILISTVLKWRIVGATLTVASLTFGCLPPDQEVIPFENGKTKSQVYVKKNRDGKTIRHGLFQSWHENGQLHERGTYINGKMCGPWTIYDEQGRKRGHQHYNLEGRRHGLWVAWHANGQLARRWQYDHGKCHGKWLTCDEDGNVIRTEIYDQGVKQP